MASENNIGDQISQAVQDAVNSQDFSKLNETVSQSMNTAASNIGKSLAAAHLAVEQIATGYSQQRALQEQQQAQFLAQREHQAALSELYRPSSTVENGGLALAITSGVCGVPCLLVGAGFLFGGSVAVAVTPIIIGIAGVAGMAFGWKNYKLGKRFRQYRDIIDTRTFCYVEELASRTGDSQGNVVKNLQTMLKRGLFKQAAMDDTNQFIIMNSDAYQDYRAAQAEALEKKKRNKLMGTTQDAPAELTAEAKDLLARGEAYVTEMREANEAIEDPEVSAKIDRIETVVRSIFKRASEQPAVIDDLGHLMDYYLPTTVKLLDAYRELDEQPVQSDSIAASKREISATLDTLSTAFEKLLDSVFRDMTWDVSTDISVLHTVLAQEGLTSSPFDAKPAASAAASATPEADSGDATSTTSIKDEDPNQPIQLHL